MKLTHIGSGCSASSVICLFMTSLSLSKDLSKNTNSENFQAHPSTGMYWMAFFA